MNSAPRIAACALLFVALLVVYVQDNRFPFQYHNDEPSKVQQVVKGIRNLRHPPLMLDATTLLWRGLPWEQSPQNAAIAGRWLSAVSVAAACAILGLVLSRTLGFAGFAGAAIVGIQPSIFECAHYFKEDSLFLAALAVFLLVSASAERKPSLLRFILLGGAVGFAASTKYAGWTLLPCALLLALFTAAPAKPGHLVLAVLLTAIVSATLLHASAFVHLSQLDILMKEEIPWMLHGHYGTGHSIPHTINFLYLGNELPLLSIAVCSAAVLLLGGMPLRDNPRTWRTLCVWAAGFVLILSFMAKTSDRYMLPILFLLLPIGMLGMWIFIGKFVTDSRTLLFYGFLGILFFLSAPGFLDRGRGFSTDDRKELTEWINNHLPDDVRFAQDDMVNLAQADPALADKIKSSSFFIPDAGTLEEMRALGITHVAVSWDVHHRFIGERYTSFDAGSTVLLRRTEFYRRLHKETQLLWKSENHNPKTLHPGLFLFAL